MNHWILITIIGVILPTILLAQIIWTEHPIDPNFDGARSVYAEDIDGDGDMDVLGAAQYANDIVWWKNLDGSGTSWQKLTIAGTFGGARSVYAIDIEPDGDIDVLGAGVTAHQITWWENNGSESFNPHTIATNFFGAYSVYAKDIEPDGDVDVLGAADGAHKITWWKNNGSENFNEITIDYNFEYARSVYAEDIDGDGDVDVLGASYADKIVWWENDGNENFTRYPIDTLFDGAISVYAADIEPDGDVDIFGAGYLANEIAWWENNGSQYFTKHIINSSPFTRAYSVYVKDIDGDGDNDILGAAEAPVANEIAWWENDGDENFIKHTIDAAFDGASSVYAEDIDGDGAIDILGAAYRDDAITWWESDLTPVEVIDVGAISIDIPDTVLENTTLIPEAHVKNFGTDAATFNVVCVINSGAEILNTMVNNLGPDDSIQVSFPEFTFVSGNYTIKVYTELAGDEEPSNDTLEKVIATKSILFSFHLILPADSAMLSNDRPTLIWESSGEIGGLEAYEVYIDNILRHTGIDTSWTVNYDLPEDWHDWYVIAYDTVDNSLQSIETWSMLIDITDPSAITLISPSDGAYLNNSTIDFVWYEATDNLSGVDEYILQYSQDNSFSIGVIEDTLVDTTFTTVLSDTIWYWRVKAKDKALNEGAWSSIWSFEIDTEAPDAPTLFSPIDGVWLSDTLVIFEWTEIRNFALTAGRNQRVNSGRESDKTLRSQVKYLIQVDTLFDFISPLITDTLDETSTAIVLFEDFYYWRVKAFDQAGNQGPFADPDSFGVDITTAMIESTTVWNDTTFAGPFEIMTKVIDNLSGVDSVLLYYKRDEDPEWVSLVMSLSGSPDWYMDSIPTVINANDTVRYYIEVVDRSEPANIATDPENAPTDYYWFITNYNTSVIEYENTPIYFSFGLKNNPAKGEAIFNLVLPHEAFITLSIYDITGRLIDRPICAKKPAGYQKISWTRDISSGIFFYRLDSPWQRKVGKLVLLK
jgi:hypothetical protein